MITKFDFKGYKAEFNHETSEIMCEDVFANPAQVIAKLNKLFRDKTKNRKKDILNIGCGYRPMIDMTNLDIDPDVFPDIVRDIDEGLPFDDNKFKGVYTSHVIEHVDDVFFFMWEIWRVCKDKSKVIILCPYGVNIEIAIQPDHKRFINYEFFNRWVPGFQSVQNEDRQLRGARFNILKTEILNGGAELKFELEVAKPKEPQIQIIRERAKPQGIKFKEYLKE